MKNTSIKDKNMKTAIKLDLLYIFNEIKNICPKKVIVVCISKTLHYPRIILFFVPTPYKKILFLLALKKLELHTLHTDDTHILNSFKIKCIYKKI